MGRYRIHCDTCFLFCEVGWLLEVLDVVLYAAYSDDQWCKKGTEVKEPEEDVATC